MKFSIKVVVGVLWIVITCFTFGGSYIIDTNFQMLLSEQKNISKNITETIYNLLKNDTKGYNSKTLGHINNTYKDFVIQDIADSININVEGKKINFSIISKTNIDLNWWSGGSLNSEWLDKLEINKRAYTFEKVGEKNYIKTIRPFVFLENVYYIFIYKEITHIFKNQEQQYEVLIKTTILLSFISVMMSVVFSKVLLHQVVELNKVTKEMGEGNIQKRVKVNGNDELAELARNFNKMADSLKNYVEMLEEESQNKENFVSAFSHEVKTPLTAIIGYADMLRTNPNDINRIQKGAEYIFSEGKRLEQLSKRLLQIMAIKNQELKFVEVQIKMWIESISDNLKYYLSQRNIELEVNVENDFLVIEPILINMVIVNIVDNAQKASKDGEKIFINGKIEGQYYTLKIKDRGIGIDSKILSKIKEPFYKADPSRVRNKNGAGLGLSLSQIIIEKHDAKMNIYSEINIGTTVELVFIRRKSK